MASMKEKRCIREGYLRGYGHQQAIHVATPNPIAEYVKMNLFNYINRLYEIYMEH